MKTFINKYGVAVFTPLTNVMRVADISYDKCPIIKGSTLTTVQAEEIALITDNNNVQLVCVSYKNEGIWYAILHDSTHTAQICDVTIESFTPMNGRTAQETIEYLAPKYPCVSYV